MVNIEYKAIEKERIQGFPSNIKGARKWESDNIGSACDELLVYPGRTKFTDKALIIIGHHVAIAIDLSTGLVANSGVITGPDQIEHTSGYEITGKKLPKVTFYYENEGE